jgi:hypothetical protein
MFRNAGGQKGESQMSRSIFICAATVLIFWMLPAQAGPFVDVPSDPWDGTWMIDKLQCEGFIEGYPDNYFRGNQPFTRYEAAMVMARVLARLLGEISVFNPALADVMAAQATAPSEISFADVPSDHWAYEAVKALENTGILIGRPGARFDGNRPVTRSELAAMLSRMWRLLPSPFGKNAPSIDESKMPSFTDLPEDSWAYSDVTFLVRIGAVQGYPDGTYRGRRTYTRSEMAMVIARWWDRFAYELEAKQWEN